MITLNQLENYLQKLMFFNSKLDVEKIDPFMTNGLMVKGSDQIKNIGFTVSASVEIFKKAAEKKCQTIVVHHSFNLPKNHNYDYIFQERMAFLIKNNISLFGYHFLLDTHPEIGNNVSILKVIGANVEKPYLHHGSPWGYTGGFKESRSLSEIKKILNKYLSPRSIYYDFGPPKVRRVVAVSGKGAPVASDMTALINDKIDLYITGEVHEWNRELFREAKINFIAGGHYHTEMFGIKALMKKVKKDHPQVSTIWLELENQV